MPEGERLGFIRDIKGFRTPENRCCTLVGKRGALWLLHRVRPPGDAAMTPIEAVQNLTAARAAVEAARAAFVACKDPVEEKFLFAALKNANRARAAAEKLRVQFAPQR